MAINSQPVIILVEPQLGENIGMCARAMLNCGLQRLRLVNPRQGWPNKAATATAADADIVLKEIAEGHLTAESNIKEKVEEKNDLDFDASILI